MILGLSVKKKQKNINMNILFLDDSLERIKQFRSWVPSATIVENASDCIKKLENEAWDIVFLDHDLGGLEYVATHEKNTGSEVVRWIIGNKPSVGRFVVHSLNFNAAQGMVADLVRADYDALAVSFITLDEYLPQLIREPSENSAEYVLSQKLKNDYGLTYRCAANIEGTINNLLYYGLGIDQAEDAIRDILDHIETTDEDPVYAVGSWRDAVKEAVQDGHVEWQNPEAMDRCLETINAGKTPDFTVVDVSIDGNIGVTWATRTAGFGSVSFWIEDSKIMCDNETMDRQFVKDVLCKLVDESEFVDGK